jgi:hypothetical protein
LYLSISDWRMNGKPTETMHWYVEHDQGEFGVSDEGSELYVMEQFYN